MDQTTLFLTKKTEKEGVFINLMNREEKIKKCTFNVEILTFNRFIIYQNNFGKSFKIYAAEILPSTEKQKKIKMHIYPNLFLFCLQAELDGFAGINKLHTEAYSLWHPRF